jgi:hypothetical protein
MFDTAKVLVGEYMKIGKAIDDVRGSHEHFQSREDVKTSSDRSFGLVFFAVFVLIGMAPLAFGGAFRPWAILIAFVFLVFALAYPRALAPLNTLWTRFGFLLHRIVNPLIMALLFFLVVTPIGLLMRALGKRPLNLALDLAATSYWIDRVPQGPAPETMKQQF